MDERVDNIADQIEAVEQATGLNLHNMAALTAFLSGNFEGAVIAGTPGGIRAQEEAGQRTFVGADTLPQELLRCTRAQLEALGIVFGADADDLFVAVQLPAGWQKRPTDHHMWTDLLDDQGRVRAHIFYKAAFYDRHAHLSLAARYGITSGRGACPIADDDASDQRWVGVRDTATGAILFHTPYQRDAAYDTADSMEAADKACAAWLAEHYPDHADPLAYWDS